MKKNQSGMDGRPILCDNLFHLEACDDSWYVRQVETTQNGQKGGRSRQARCMSFGNGIPTSHTSSKTALNSAVLPTTRVKPKIKPSNHRQTTPSTFQNWGVTHLRQEQYGTNIMRQTFATDISSTNHIVITPKYNLSDTCTFNGEDFKTVLGAF